MYFIEPYGVAVEVDLYGGSEAVFDDVFDPSDFPLMLVIGINVVVFAEFLVEVVVFEFYPVLPQHLYKIYMLLQKIYFNKNNNPINSDSFSLQIHT